MPIELLKNLLGSFHQNSTRSLRRSLPMHEWLVVLFLLALPLLIFIAAQAAKYQRIAFQKMYICMYN